MFKHEIRQLKNGLKVLMVPEEECFSVKAMILTKAGALYEPESLSGISHFMEHMCFKGSKKRPSSLALTSALDQIGGRYNAFTGYEYTGYFAKVDSNHSSLALDIIADIFIHANYPKKELEREKGVVIEEINMYQDDPKLHIYDLWMELLYGNQPAGRSVAGTKETVGNMNREKLLDYRDKLYLSDSSLLVLSGNFKSDAILKQAEKYFQGIKKGKGYDQTETKKNQSRPATLIQNKQTDQTHLVLGFPSYDYLNPKRYALTLMNSIFDGGMSGILFQLVREKLGAAYYVHSEYESFKDSGFWGVSAGLNNERIEEVLKAIILEIKNLKNKHITKKSLENAKQYIIGHVSLGLDDAHEYADSLAFKYLLKDTIETPYQYLNKIKKVSLDEVRAVSKEILDFKKINLAVIGPFKNKKIFDKIIEI